MNKFNYILNDLALSNLITRCLYSENASCSDKEELENQIKLIQQENKQLKEKNENLELNLEIIRQYCLDEQIPEETDEYNSYIEFSNSVYDNILNKMEELEEGVSDVED